jgi:hypothetical protein
MQQFFIDWQGYLSLIIGSLLTSLGVIASTAYNNKTDILTLNHKVDSLMTERKDHDNAVDEQLAEIRHDIKNLLSRK